MNLTINVEGTPLHISKKLTILLETLIANQQTIPDVTGFIVNFRDTNYGPDTGGYHPVEVGISLYDGIWQIDYLTDFSICAGPFPEMVIELDFNCQENMLFSLFQKPALLEDSDTQDFYQLWEANFLSYVEMKCLDEITVTPVC